MGGTNEIKISYEWIILKSDDGNVRLITFFYFCISLHFKKESFSEEVYHLKHFLQPYEADSKQLRTMFHKENTRLIKTNQFQGTVQTGTLVPRVA